MTTVLSALLWFTSHHAIITLFLALALAGLTAPWHRRVSVGVVTFVVFMLNIFLGQFVNAAYLHWVGERGVAVIVASEQTNSMLNEQYIWRYHVVVRTADGRDVETVLHTDTAALWPLRNSIRIPGTNEPFPVQYVPGFPRNIVILTDESPSGIAHARARAHEQVQVAARKLRFSPGNAGFRNNYRDELNIWLKLYGDDPQQQADAEHYRAELRALDAGVQ